MKPLIVLLSVSFAALLLLKISSGKYEFAFSGRIGMSAMLLFTALGHFMFPDGMALMVPDLLPYKRELVYLTAIFEIAGAIGLHFQHIRPLTAWLLILFFIAIIPSNIKASLTQLNYQTGNFDGHGVVYLWFRIPLQILFIAWIYLSSLKTNV